MTPAATPARSSYDIIIVGGAIMGSSTAWFLSNQPGFDGKVLVVEKDPSYEFCSTTHTNSCMRQQFSTELNVRISQFAAAFVKNIRDHMGGDERVPELGIQSFGYMYLADNPNFAQSLRESHAVQQAAGAATQLMSAEEIKAAIPFIMSRTFCWAQLTAWMRAIGMVPLFSIGGDAKPKNAALNM